MVRGSKFEHQDLSELKGLTRRPVPPYTLNSKPIWPGALCPPGVRRTARPSAPRERL